MSAATPTLWGRPRLSTVPPVAVVLLCALQLLLGVAWSVVTPTFRAPDEPQHVDLALHLSRGHPYPEPGTMRLSRQVTQAGAVARFAEEEADQPDRDVRFRAEDAAPRRHRPGFAALAEDGQLGRVPNQMSQHPPLYYAAAGGLLALVPETASYDVQVWLLRLLGAVLVAPVPWLAYATAAWLIDDRRVALAAAALPLAVPMLAHIAGAVGNDAPLALLGGLFTLGLARMLAGDVRLRVGTLLGVAAGLGMLVKAFALAWLVALPAAAVVAVRCGRSRRVAALACAGYALALALVVGGWWYVRNLLTVGSVQPTLGPFPDVDDGVGFGSWLWLAVSRLPLRFWGQFGWVEFPLPWTLVWLLTAAVAAAVAAALLRRRSALAELRESALVLLIPLAASLAVVLVGAFRLWLLSDAPMGLHGRYLYGGLVGLAVVAALGAVAVAGWRARWVPAGVAVVAAALHAFSGWLALRHWWGPVDPDTAVVSARALVVWSPLPPRALTALTAALVLVAAAALVSTWAASRTARPTARAHVRLGS